MRINYIRIIERLRGYHVMKELPHGVDLLTDVRRQLPQLRIDIIFDVGANVGQSSRVFAHRCPGATIFAFEPSPENASLLEKAVASKTQVTCIRAALGDVVTTKTMVGCGGSARIGEGGTPVVMETLDHFCSTRHIERISLLKIDTEGYDKKVLEGGAKLLGREAVDAVQVEAGMNPGNTLHVSMESMKSYLESFGYMLFGLYDQVQEWPSRSPVLRRVNAVFVSGRIATENAGTK